MSTNAADGATDPVLARFLVDSTLHQLRKADKRGSYVLAELAGVSRKTWDRWTGGRGQNSEWRQPQILAAMDALGYGRNDPTTLDLLRLAADARKNNVVSSPEWLRSTAFDLLVSIERVSESIHTYENTLMPGLLQTEQYARAYLAGGPKPDGFDLDERVRVRMERQEILTRSDQPLAYTAVIDEAVLHRSPGSDPEVMRGQLRHLLELGARPNVTIRVVPFSAGPYGTDGNGPFVVLDSKRVGRRIVFVETSAANTYFETPEANQRYEAGWNRIAERAWGTEESTGMIRSLLQAA